jgi:hypothetical protein
LLLKKQQENAPHLPAGLIKKNSFKELFLTITKQKYEKKDSFRL